LNASKNSDFIFHILLLAGLTQALVALHKEKWGLPTSPRHTIYYSNYIIDGVNMQVFCSQGDLLAFLLLCPVVL
jgi:hypothetical protein